MESRISWGELLTILSTLLFVYYAVVIFVFYRMEFLALLKGRQEPTRYGDPYPAATPAQAAGQTDASENVLYNQVLELMQDCKPVFQAAVEHSLEKSQVLEALQLRLQKYPQIIGTAFQVAVSNHIDQELQARCGLSLDDGDMETLWR